MIKLKRAKKYMGVVLAISMSVTSAMSVFGDMVKVDNSDVASVGSIPEGAFSITAEPEAKSEINKGDVFYVDFIAKNNPGFACYGFTVSYDETIVKPLNDSSYISMMNEAAEVKYEYEDENSGQAATAGISASFAAKAIGKAENGSFDWGTNLTAGGVTVSAVGDGVLLRIYFQALAAGSTDIRIRNKGPLFFGDKNGDKITGVYVKDATVQIIGDSEENTAASGSQTETDSDTSEDTSGAEKTAETVTEVSAEQTTEQTAEIIQGEENSDGFIINLPTEKTAQKGFGDLDFAVWAKDAILNLSSLGIINGVSDSAFNPKANTYRADFVVVISRLLGLSGDAQNVFSDVDDGAYYAGAVSLANKFDLVKGNGTAFMPKNNITRQDAMVILSRVLEKAGKLKISDESVLNKFSDKGDISAYAVSSMANLAGMGILNGDDNGKINPKGFITRAEMAVVIDRIYNILA